MLVVWYILNQINCEHRKTNTIPRSVAFIEKYLYKYFDMKWNMNEKKQTKSRFKIKHENGMVKLGSGLSMEFTM